jgi:hypothetical protein
MNTLMKYIQNYRVKTKIELIINHLLTCIKLINLDLEKLLEAILFYG